MENEELHQELFGTKKEPRKSLHTFLRNQNKMVINSFNMIDRKAAIMIRINATIISVIIVFFDYVKSIEMGEYIGAVMVIASFISLLLAINASRPHIFKLFRRFNKKLGNNNNNLEEKLFSVGMFDNVPLQEYLEAYDKVVKNQDLQVGNQIRTLYILERYTKDAFLHLELSYWAFMMGFTAMVGLFVYGSII
ncbi:Pycsar system effector family protein [Robertkochia solimangrovi]|uniref:Pycsar system effector family protein n=1 Tax=Robertkochia solimangrovi TaxID=2213046 RepID=UPI00117CC970|nr:Pycsar system effector family protein [Robertkochia solimangrovi]TRZ45117.1 hypothetical protein DMZ48_05025 [Robertkochia solimangrovi]